MAARARLDELLPEARLGILRCVCGGTESLPARSLQALAQTSREWHWLSAAPEILPFSASLNCRLLTPRGPCKRAGNVWPPAEPLEAHRLRDSQPLGERDALAHCLHTCLRRGFAPALDLHAAHLHQGIDLETWIRHLRGFRDEHFSGESGRPGAASSPEEGVSPPPAWCAAAATLPGRRICVVGGGCYGFELADAQTNSVEVFWHSPCVHVFDLAARRWERQAVSGDLPPPAHTYAAAHASIGGRLLIWCGGYYGQSYNSAYALDTESWKWHALRNSSAHSPSPRYFVASFGHLGGLYSWGGRGSQQAYFADLWRLDPSRVHQDVVHSDEVRTCGELPPAKFAATLTNCDGRFAVLFGGGQWKLGGRFKPDIETFTLDLESYAWTRLSLHGPRPMPRCQHSAVNLGGNMVLILGGYDGCVRRYLGLDDVAVLNVRGLRWMTLGRSLALRRGLRVRLAGLRGRPELNGYTGTLVRFSAERDRWHVRLDGDTSNDKFFRAANLRPLEEEEWQQQAPASSAEARQPALGEQEGEDPGAASDGPPGEDSDSSGQRADSHAPSMLAPCWEEALGRTRWIHGQFPCPRAGMALAEVQEEAGRRAFYLFGGAQYVHQEWYGDLYECSLSRMAGEVLL